MKTKIRKSVFETNSSSSHSIVVCENGEYTDHLTVDEDDRIIIGYNGKTEFGWEIKENNDADSKLNYLMLLSNEDRKERIIEIIKEHTGCKEVYYCIKKYWGDDDTQVETETGDLLDKVDGYVDHNSQDILEYEDFTTNFVLDFVFNPKSIIYTDNDNH